MKEPVILEDGGANRKFFDFELKELQAKKLRPILGISPLTSTIHQMEPSGGSGITARLYQTGSMAWLPCSRAVGSTTALTQLPLTLQ